MNARRGALGVVAMAGLGLGSLTAACSTEMTLRKAAIGTWDCKPSGEGAMPLVVTVKDGGAFTIRFKRGSGEDQSINGGWNLDGSELDLNFTGQASAVPPMRVTGVEEDATAIALDSLDGPDSKTVVKRTGWDKVTFRDSKPGSTTFTCTKR